MIYFHRHHRAKWWWQWYTPSSCTAKEKLSMLLHTTKHKYTIWAMHRYIIDADINTTHIPLALSIYICTNVRIITGLAFVVKVASVYIQLPLVLSIDKRYTEDSNKV